jgi:hypothetical protein
MDKSELDALLTRLHESARYLLKADALALAGLVTLATMFKMEPGQILGFAASRLWVIDYIVWLMVSLLVYEGLLTTVGRGGDSKASAKISLLFRGLYALIVLAHIGALAFTLGYIDGFLQSLNARLNHTG